MTEQTTTEQPADAGNAAPENTSNEGNAAQATPTPTLAAGEDSPSPDGEATATPSLGLEPDEGTPEGEQPEAKEEPEGAPESYEAFTVPDGAEPLDEGVVTAFGEAAKQANLSQQAAQGLLDKMTPALAEARQSQMQRFTEEWAKASMSDEEFGGEKLEENLAVAKRAYQRLAPPELRELLRDAGLEAHPDMIRTFYRAGRALSDDRFVGEGTEGGDRKVGDHPDDAQRKLLAKRYPTLQK